jgi:hypothetical protein
MASAVSAASQTFIWDGKMDAPRSGYNESNHFHGRPGVPLGLYDRKGIRQTALPQLSPTMP